MVSLWSGRRTPTLPVPIRRAWAPSLPHGRASVLAAARVAAPDEERWLVLSPGWLSLPHEQGWQHLAWHEVMRGGWQDADRQLHWTLLSGRHGSVLLNEAGRVPEVFRERVQASFAFEQVVDVRTGDHAGTIVVSARRDLTGDTSQLTWHTDVQRGLTWSTPGVREAADRALARLRAEYDPG